MEIGRMDTFVAVCGDCRKEERFTVINNAAFASRTYGKLPEGWGYIFVPPHYPAAYTGPKDWDGTERLLCPECLIKRNGVSV